ncbi:MAG: hypothetical protein JXB04_05345 [Kiritimatiellae bacterium]|nr:hypothetical protein [Kiritimatiellia bacterium]
MSRSRLFACAVLLYAFSVSSGHSAAITCAILPREDVASVFREAIPNLEQCLTNASARITLVDRSDLDALFTPEVRAMLAKDERAGRELLSRNLSADYLLFLSGRVVGEKRFAQLDVVNTRSGLAQASIFEVVLPSDPSWSCRLAQRAAAVCLRPSSDDCAIAVPPFQCLDLKGAGSRWKEALAMAIQDRLSLLSDCQIVELKESGTLYNELFMENRADQLERPVMPYYVLGKYRTHKSGASLSFDIECELWQGSELKSRWSRADLAASAMGNALDALCGWILSLALASDGHAEPASPDEELPNLLDSAEGFLAMGEPMTALPLLEMAILLDPDEPATRKMLLESLTDLADWRRGRAVSASWLPQNETERHLWIAEESLYHWEHLLALSETTEDLRETIRSYRQALMLPNYLWADALQRFPEGFAQYYSDRVRALIGFCHRTRKAGRLREEDISFMTMESLFQIDNLLLFDDRSAAAHLNSLVDLLIESGHAEAGICQVLTWLNTREIRGANAGMQAAGLAHALRQRLQAEARSPEIAAVLFFEGLITNITDEVTQQRQWAALHSLPEFQRLGSHDKETLRHQTENYLQYVIKRNQQAPLQMPNAVKLIPLEVPAGPAGDGAQFYVNDWSACGPERDAIATDRGVLLLSTGGHVASAVTGTAWRVRHDGQYLWAIMEAGITCLDPATGAACTISRQDLPFPWNAGVLMEPVRTGEILVAGSARGPEGALRSWIGAVSVLPAHGRLSLRVRTLNEARTKCAGNRAHDVAMATEPFCIAVSETADPAASPYALVCSLGCLFAKPLRVNLNPDAVSVIDTRWPGQDEGFFVLPLVVSHGSRFYILNGRLYKNRNWAAVFEIEDPRQSPRLVANFGIYDSTYADGWGGPYFGSAVIYDGVLHALTRFIHTRPQWLAVDLSAGTPFSITRDVREGESGRLNSFFAVSDHYGLLLISEGKVYQARLAPKSTWKRFPGTPTDELLLKNWHL